MEDWSYAETVAWIVKRDGQAVVAVTRDLSDRRQKYKRGLIALMLSADPVKVIDIDAVDQMIIQAARGGQITVEGLENGRGEYRPIPVNQFRDCAFFDDGSAGLVFGHENWGNNTVPKWTRIQFNSDQIQRNWPQSPRIFAKVTARRKCENWLTGLMSNNSDKEKPKAFFREKARDEFGIGPRAFDECWRNVVAQTGNIKWSKAGRPGRR